MTVTPAGRSTSTGTPAARGLVVLLGALTALGPLSIDLYLPALPQLGRDLAASPSTIQLTLTACLVGLALGQAVAGPLSDRHGRRRPLLVGLVLYALASLLCAVAPSPGALIAARLLQGLAGGAAIVIARAVVSDLYEGRAAARFFSTLMQISGIAPILSPLAGGLLMQWSSWRGLFLAVTSVGTLLLAATLLLPETVRRRSDAPLLRTLLRVGSDRTFAGYALTSGLSFAAMFAYIGGSPFVLQDLHGLSPLTFSVVFAANGLGIVLAGQLSSRLTRYRPETLLTAGLVVAFAGGAVVLGSVLLGLGLWPLLAGFFLVVASIGVTLPNSVSLALSTCPPEATGSASALLGLAQFVIGGLVAPLAGLGSDLLLAVIIATLTALALLTRSRTARTGVRV
ncbi:multidrug effflux MFS transporter [Nonomuraea sp. NPDC050556]|uniref:multidrug effflux MFS transporter n=1 Tax=Nonomuraea sp. NPDC050556 TaxID=3364369 RepID=UPI0037A904A5